MAGALEVSCVKFHGPWTLTDDVVRAGTMTSWPSLKADLIMRAPPGVDQEIVNDTGLVTSRKPADIPAFNQKRIEEFTEGKHNQQRAAGVGP
jgi:deglycase